MILSLLGAQTLMGNVFIVNLWYLQQVAAATASSTFRFSQRKSLRGMPKGAADKQDRGSGSGSAGGYVDSTVNSTTRPLMSST